jgi:lipoprotein NlpI
VADGDMAGWRLVSHVLDALNVQVVVVVRLAESCQAAFSLNQRSAESYPYLSLGIRF